MLNLKIAYISTYNAQNVNNWSGLGYYMAKTIEKYLGEITYFGNLDGNNTIYNIISKYWKYFKNNILYDSSRLDIAKKYARIISNQIDEKHFDIIFSPGTIPIALLDTKIPIIFWTDANFHGMINYYMMNPSDKTVKIGDFIEKSALEKSKLAVYSSEWAAKGAIEFYKTDSNKVKVIPFGPNMEYIPNVNDLNNKLDNEIKLLFVGKQWERKGGTIAYNTVKELNERGVKASLKIVGCIPPKGYNDDNIEIIANLDKNKKEDRNKLNKLYLESSFFILPTRADCTPVVFSEAAAYGVPVLSSKTGGLETIIKDNVNGFLFPLECTGKQYADKIIEIMNDGSYENLCKSSRKMYDQVLNWDAAGEKLKLEIEKIL